jgi:tetratricopeptide (TPR) repeat protein
MIGLSGVAAAAHLDIGIARFNQERFSEAVWHFERTLEIEPDNRYAQYNRATALLSLGDYERGFPAYDATWRLFRWRGFGPDIDRLAAALPLWPGVRGSGLLVYHELGFGDAIMAFRYLPEIRRRAAVTLLIDPALARLARTFDVDVTTEVPADIGCFDHRIPLFGLMAALQQTATNIPSAPYIAASGQRLPRSIGIAWSGRTQTGFSLDSFLSRLAHHGYGLYALQPGATTGSVVEPMPAGCDFADVAERIARMEHIVSVDTAAIHLAGAMGHPSAHLLLPRLMDWRWWHTERWYPQLRTYRESTNGDWTTAFAGLNQAIAENRPCT